MKRFLADLALSLYPKAWRQRYAEEVDDLLASRPVRMRTVVDLVRGAADAWLHLRRVPGSGPVRIPLAAVLTVAGAALLLLWNPGVRDVASLHGVWAEAASVGLAADMRGMAQTFFTMASIQGVLSVAPLLRTCLTASRHSVHGPAVRLATRRVVVTALFLAIPVGLVGAIFVGHVFFDWGYPVGPLGTAMVGGFFVPLLMALVLPLPMMAAEVPALGYDTRGTGTALAVAAICHALAWMCVAAVLVMGAEKASWSFVGMVTASALLSVWMSALVARSVLKRSRTMLSELNLA
ncbi:hypothetical protein ACFOY2_00790 [Nonomuraea purpurea]|uniref:ABC transporter permease n=1 Tax=Nonomuraea purpurea TaxID=1849276 RepID=A0ABV8FZQ5_9ACTN